MGKRLFKLLLAYSSILLGFYFAFGIVFGDNEKKEMNHTIYRINKILSMSMGEVDTSFLKNPFNTTHKIYQNQFWAEVHISGHLMYTVFCLTVPMLILNILTAFAIKVWIHLNPSNIPIHSQDVEEVLRDAEINKLKTQADYLTFVEESFLSK